MAGTPFSFLLGAIGEGASCGWGFTLLELGGQSAFLLGRSHLEGRLSYRARAGACAVELTRLDYCRQVNTPEAAPPLDR